MEPVYKDVLEKIRTCKNAKQATLVFLHGDLGAGKTTFTKNYFKYLGFNFDITSPTFTILKTYNLQATTGLTIGFDRFVHVDAYRLGSYKDLVKIHFDEYLHDVNTIIFVEWPSIITDSNLDPDMNIFFEHTENVDERKITPSI